MRKNGEHRKTCIYLPFFVTSINFSQYLVARNLRNFAMISHMSIRYFRLASLFLSFFVLIESTGHIVRRTVRHIWPHPMSSFHVWQQAKRAEPTDTINSHEINFRLSPFALFSSKICPPKNPAENHFLQNLNIFLTISL